MCILLIIVVLPFLYAVPSTVNEVIAYCKYNVAPHDGNTVQLVMLPSKLLKQLW